MWCRWPPWEQPWHHTNSPRTKPWHRAHRADTHPHYGNKLEMRLHSVTHKNNGSKGEYHCNTVIKKIVLSIMRFLYLWYDLRNDSGKLITKQWTSFSVIWCDFSLTLRQSRLFFLNVWLQRPHCNATTVDCWLSCWTDGNPAEIMLLIRLVNPFCCKWILSYIFEPWGVALHICPPLHFIWGNCMIKV